MTLPAGHIGNSIPSGPDDVYRQIRALKQALAQRSSLSVSPGDAIRLNDEQGNRVAVIGTLGGEWNYHDDNGSSVPQTGMIMYRNDESIAAVLGDASPAIPPFNQSFQICDRHNHVVFADDADGSVGIASPYLPIPAPANTNIATWPATTAKTMTQIATGFFIRQNPRLNAVLWIAADGSTTGKFQLKLDGVVIATSGSVPGGSTVQWNIDYLFPSGWTWQQSSTLELDAQVTSGSGQIYAQFLMLAGLQS